MDSVLFVTFDVLILYNFMHIRRFRLSEFLFSRFYNSNDVQNISPSLFILDKVFSDEIIFFHFFWRNFHVPLSIFSPMIPFNWLPWNRTLPLSQILEHILLLEFLLLLKLLLFNLDNPFLLEPAGLGVLEVIAVGYRV